MANSINATSASNGGLVTTGDDSGVLNIQTNETTAISIDASQNATFTNGANLPNTFGFKNRIINGGMMIDQRNAGASITLNSSGWSFPVDRFSGYEDTDGVMTAQQVSDAPAGFVNSLKFTATTADASLGATQRVMMRQTIEGLNLVDLAFGSASASTITVSFWVKSSLTGTFGGAVQNGGGTRAYPFTYAISSANTWEQKSVTVAGDTTGTWLTTNGVGMQLMFGLGVGSTYSAAAGAWATGEYNSATGATSVIGTLNATWQVTGVQLEKGTQATSFDFRSYGTELALCQRYFELVGGRGEAAQSLFYDGYANSSGINCIVTYPFKATKRATPTMALVGTITRSNASSVTLSPFSNNVVMLAVSSAAGRCYWYNDASSYVTASAEL